MVMGKIESRLDKVRDVDRPRYAKITIKLEVRNGVLQEVVNFQMEETLSENC